MGDFMYEKILENIRYYKEKNNMSIEDLSIKTNLSIPYLSSLIKGTRKNPSLDTIDKLATAFKIDIMDLIGLE